ncbi:MAG: SDR family NAD(P)-dependent oxidoreductase [Chloroflexi bacterium]|nr:SDR family NAD(P)-dependent oxidoreductase [Chloroflexota bacterium]OJV92504.1 MAG: oxidoreductase [Chloroflexi bacterium 54-19]
METAQKPINSGFGFETAAAEVASGLDLSGKTVIITGGQGGIGLETTRVLTEAGARVVVGARDPEKALENLAGLKNTSVSQLDLADPASIDRFAQNFLTANSKLDILINNAGIMATPLMRDSRGYEMQFATNHLGHFQLTVRLWQALANAKNSRVVTLTSFGHRFGNVNLEDPNFLNRPYEKWAAYGQSKSANSLFSVELDRRGQASGIRAFAVHPGRILSTDLMRFMSEEDKQGALRTAIGSTAPNTVFEKTIPQGAATTVWCAVSPQLEGKGGVYCADCDISPVIAENNQDAAGVRPWAVDKATAQALWELSEQLVFAPATAS